MGSRAPWQRGFVARSNRAGVTQVPPPQLQAAEKAQHREQGGGEGAASPAMKPPQVLSTPRIVPVAPPGSTRGWDGFVDVLKVPEMAPILRFARVKHHCSCMGLLQLWVQLEFQQIKRFWSEFTPLLLPPGHLVQRETPKPATLKLQSHLSGILSLFPIIRWRGVEFLPPFQLHKNSVRFPPGGQTALPAQSLCLVIALNPNLHPHMTSNSEIMMQREGFDSR